MSASAPAPTSGSAPPPSARVEPARRALLDVGAPPLLRAARHVRLRGSHRARRPHAEGSSRGAPLDLEAGLPGGAGTRPAHAGTAGRPAGHVPGLGASPGARGHARLGRLHPAVLRDDGRARRGVRPVRAGSRWIQGAFYGIGAAVIAIIARSAWKLTKLSLKKDCLLWAIFTVTGVVTAITESEIVWVFLGAGVLADPGEAPPRLRRTPPPRRGPSLALHRPRPVRQPDLLWRILGYFAPPAPSSSGAGSPSCLPPRRRGERVPLAHASGSSSTPWRSP